MNDLVQNVLVNLYKICHKTHYENLSFIYYLFPCYTDLDTDFVFQIPIVNQRIVMSAFRHLLDGHRIIAQAQTLLAIAQAGAKT